MLSGDSSPLCDLSSFALGFATCLSILNRNSLYSREITTSLLCLDCSSEEQTLLPLPQFCPGFFQLHLTSAQEKGLHLSPHRRTKVLPQGRYFLSLWIFFSHFLLDTSYSDTELSHEAEPQRFFIHDDISGKKFETFLLNPPTLRRRQMKCKGGWKEIYEDQVNPVGFTTALCPFFFA